MRIHDFSTIALSLWLLAGGTIPHALADETSDRPTAPVDERLASQSELDAVCLNLIDEKLALSLAVETHIQIELLQLALPGIRHDDVKHFAERRLSLYRQMLNTLDELTCGRVGKTLPRAPLHAETAATTSDSPPPVPPVDGAHGSAKPGRKGGIGNVMQNVATQAILRVRLEIADQYLHLLRAELETVPPDDYDRHYLGIETNNQMQMLAMLRVFEKQASPDFARIIRLATVATESHFAEARHVVERLQSVPQIVPAGPTHVAGTANTAGP